MDRTQRKYKKWFEKQIKKEKNARKALLQIAGSLWEDDFSNESTSFKAFESLVIAAYSHSPDTARDYENMMTRFVRKCRDEIETNKIWEKGCVSFSVDMGPSYWEYDHAIIVLNLLEDTISWVKPSESAHVDIHNVVEEKTALQRDVREPDIAKSISKDAGMDGKTRKRVLGVLRSFPRISITDLSKYSGLSQDASRDLLFELLGDNLVSGRFDVATDEFISAPAATASRKIRSDSPTLARCLYCGKSLGKAPISGEEVTCPSCGMLNVG